MTYNPELEEVRTRRQKEKGKLAKTIRNTADSLTLWLLNYRFFDRIIAFLSYQQKRVMRRRAETRLREKGLYGNTVNSGPFRGLTYPPHDELWISSRFEKIIGIYEIELFEVLERVIRKEINITEVINIGAADGFYSIGLARALPNIPGLAFESKPEAREAIAKIARLNDVSEKLEILGDCNPKALAQLEISSSPLVVCDVDGYELVIMDKKEVPWLENAYILLELHDIDIAGITKTIEGRFKDSHEIEHIEMKGFSYADYPLFRELTFSEIHALSSSDRPGIQDWFFMSPKTVK